MEILIVRQMCQGWNGKRSSTAYAFDQVRHWQIAKQRTQKNGLRGAELSKWWGWYIYGIGSDNLPSQNHSNRTKKLLTLQLPKWGCTHTFVNSYQTTRRLRQTFTTLPKDSIVSGHTCTRRKRKGILRRTHQEKNPLRCLKETWTLWNSKEQEGMRRYSDTEEELQY